MPDTTWIRSVTSDIKALEEQAKSSFRSVQQSTEGIVRSVQSASSEAQKHLDQLQQTVNDAAKNTATKLDDLKYTLEQTAKDGNTTAQLLLNVIKAVENGTLNALDAINAFGDGITNIDGRTRSFRDLLSEVLPTMGQVQNQIHDTIAGIHSYEDAIAALNKIQTIQAKTLADLITAYKNGKITIDALVRAALELQRTLPGGSAEGQIAGAIADAVRNGGFG